MKRIVSVILTIAILCTLTVGCTEKSEKDVSQVNTDTQTAKPEAVEFSWLGHKMQISYVLDDGTVTNGSTPAEGRYIQVNLECVDGSLTWEDITANYTDFTLIDKSETVYEAACCGFSLVGEQSVDINALATSEFSDLSPVFDIPKDMALEDLALLVNAEDVRINLASVSQ